MPLLREPAFGERGAATRMLHDGRRKLVYYAVGSRRQLFDLERDPDELRDVAGDPAYADALARLTDLLVSQLYGGDEAWVQGGVLRGLPDQEYATRPNKGLSGQRGSHWPPPPPRGGGE